MNNIYLKFFLGSKKLKIPLHLVLENEENEWICTCLEITQVYGSGASKLEAVEMIEREILSVNNDLHDGSKYSEEFEELKKFLDLISEGEI